MQNAYRKVPGVDGWGDYFDPEKPLTEPYLFETPYDDAAPFFNFLALPASDMYYGADYGMYHSIYENFHWMKTVVDPTFEYHKLMTELQGIVGLRLANADLVPLDYATEARYWRLAYRDLQQSTKETDHESLKIQEALALIDQWEQEAKNLLNDEKEALGRPARKKTNKGQLVKMNQMIYRIARDFYHPSGLNGQITDRNLFTGIALQSDNTTTTASIYIEALKQRIRSIQAVRKQLSEY